MNFDIFNLRFDSGFFWQVHKKRVQKYYIHTWTIEHTHKLRLFLYKDYILLITDEWSELAGPAAPSVRNGFFPTTPSSVGVRVVDNNWSWFPSPSTWPWAPSPSTVTMKGLSNKSTEQE